MIVEKIGIDGKKKALRLITIKIPEHMVEELDNLVNMGLFASRSEAIRLAISKLLSEQKSLRRTHTIDEVF